MSNSSVTKSIVSVDDAIAAVAKRSRSFLFRPEEGNLADGAIVAHFVGLYPTRASSW